MRYRLRLGLMAASCAVLLSFATSAATARRFSLNNPHFRISWPELRITIGGVTVRCPVRFEGAFHSRTISKVCGQLIGYIETAGVTEASCTNGGARVLSESLPWHVRYHSFTGTLPTITEIRVMVVGLRMSFNILGVTCLVATTATEPLYLEGDVEPNGELRIFISEEVNQIAFGGALCEFAGKARFAGIGEAFVGGTNERITVRLIL